jgi:hypothetical protein
MDIFDSLFNNGSKILFVCVIVFLIFRIILLFFGKKYAQTLLRLKEDRLKIVVNSRTQLATLFKLTLWWLPVLLILLFIVNYLVVPEIHGSFMVGTIFVLELLVFVEFLYTRWLLRYLAEHKAEKEQEVEAKV